MLRQHRQRGQGIVEFALILPILLGMALGVVDFGRIYYYDVQFQSALREAARYASQHQGAGNATLTTIVQNEGTIPSSMSPSASVTQITGSGGETIEQVTGTYQFTFASPWLNHNYGIANPLTVRSFVAAEVDHA